MNDRIHRTPVMRLSDNRLLGYCDLSKAELDQFVVVFPKITQFPIIYGESLPPVGAEINWVNFELGHIVPEYGSPPRRCVIVRDQDPTVLPHWRSASMDYQVGNGDG